MKGFYYCLLITEIIRIKWKLERGKGKKVKQIKVSALWLIIILSKVHTSNFLNLRKLKHEKEIGHTLIILHEIIIHTESILFGTLWCFAYLKKWRFVLLFFFFFLVQIGLYYSKITHKILKHSKQELEVISKLFYINSLCISERTWTIRPLQNTAK